MASLEIEFIKRWNVWPALVRPIDIFKNSQSPAGVQIAVLAICSG